MNSRYFTVGIIANTHGLKGEVRVLSRTDFEKRRFRKGAKLYVRAAGKTPHQEVVVAESRQHKQFYIISFKDLPTINDVEPMKGMELCVLEDDLMPLPDGTYYIHQLVGLEVYTEDGEHVGRLTEVLTPGANDVYVVRGPLQENDVLLPAIPTCVLNVDLDTQRMTVHLIPGLLERDQED